MKISKSKFIAGVQCLKRLYLLVHARELAAQPDGSDQAIIVAIGRWQRRLRALFTLAGVEGGHAHRFRDTFAVELLLAGVLLERGLR